jgi:hypothetical protein
VGSQCVHLRPFVVTEMNDHVDATGAKMSKLELNKRATVASSKLATVAIVPAPGWAELRGNVTTN